MVVRVRNLLFDAGVLKSRAFETPTICVGNLAVGGTGKTPHVEYLLRLLTPHYKVAVLSRGYKRKTRGWVLADKKSTALDIGDEPLQMKTKFPSVTVVVDEDRCEGIRLIESDRRTRGTQVIVLDDAFQHRYVKAGLSILLTDYHRPYCADYLLPAGRLREPRSGHRRADIVVVTKCPPSLPEAERQQWTKRLRLTPSQQLFFSTIVYHDLQPLFCGDELPLSSIPHGLHILLLSGIAHPEPLVDRLTALGAHLEVKSYPDHHHYTPKDIADINDAFECMPSPRLIVTTEKDAARLQSVSGLSDDVRRHLYELPIEIRIIHDPSSLFDERVMTYIQREMTQKTEK